MRPAVINALLASPEVTELVGTRVYGRQGLEGGVNSQDTPEAYTPEGELLPTIVVTLDPRTAERTRGGAPATIRAHQLFSLWVYQQRGYDELWEIVRRGKRVLHRNRNLTPVKDPINWLDTDWDTDTAELVDPDLGASYIRSTYDALITDPLTTP